MFGQIVVRKFDLTQYMHLDSAAVRALHILPTSLDGISQLLFEKFLISKF